MNKRIKITVTDKRAEKDTQLHLLRSKLEFTEETKAIQKEILKNPCSTELWMKKGIALAKQMHFREAIEAYSIGLSYNPFHALSLRHRGHRLISTYRFEEAAFDFELSSRLNPANWDTWYHLGLAYYLIGDFERANKAYSRCLEMTKEDQEELVAIVDWKWLTLMRLGKVKEAKEVLQLVDEQTEPGENTVYKERVLMYKSDIKPENILESIHRHANDKFGDFELATQGYGVAMYYYFNGQKEKTFDLFMRILKHDTFWSAFGYIAAYQDEKRLK